jgi:hypothetical protein
MPVLHRVSVCVCALPSPLCPTAVQRLLRLQSENSAAALQQEDALQRRRDEDLVVMQEESAARREAARLASEQALQSERLAHERDMMAAKVDAETEGRLRLEVGAFAPPPPPPPRTHP